jgi:hypothetical protein
MSRLLKFCLLPFLFVVSASAVPINWVLSGVTLDDGGTVSGSFVYDVTTNSFATVNITTTNGSSRTGQVYHFVCGQDVPTCNGLTPSSGNALYLTSTAANQTGLPALALFFTPPLSNITGSRSASGLEATCNNATCAAPVPPIRNVTAGTVTSATLQPTPIPTTWLLVMTGLILAGLYTWWTRRNATLAR